MVLHQEEVKDEEMDTTLSGSRPPPGWLPAIVRTANRYRWLFYSFAAACCYACFALTARSLAGEIPTAELVTMRAGVSFCLCIVVMVYQGTDFRVSTRWELLTHAANSVFFALGTYCQFYAYQHMLAADANAIIYSYVAFTGAFARILLKEPFGWFEAAVIVLTIIGVSLVARPTFLFRLFNESIMPDPTRGVVPPLTAFAAAISIALNVVAVRAMGTKKVDVMKLVLYSNLFMGVSFALLTTALNEWSIPECTWVRFRVFLVALSGFFAITFLSHALSFENAVYVSLVLINDFFIVFVMSVVFFGFTPAWTSVVGASLIIGSSFAIFLRRARSSKPKDRKPEEIDETASSGDHGECGDLDEPPRVCVRDASV